MKPLPETRLTPADVLKALGCLLLLLLSPAVVALAVGLAVRAYRLAANHV